MVLYDSIIEKIGENAGSAKAKTYSYNVEHVWPVAKEYELILQKEMAYELGGDNKPAVNFTCVTTNPEYFNGDEVVVYGSDLPQIQGSVPYARISLVLADGIDAANPDDTESLFRAIQAIDFVKYRVFPKGYMVRTSGQTGREQVRISKKAIKAGMTFERVGASFIRKYKVNKQVRNVKVIFITAEDANYQALTDASKKVSEITHSLSQILEGLPTECGSCGLKDICDEVEGLKELHFGQKKEKSTGV